jgi:hypothetical protein
MPPKKTPTTWLAHVKETQRKYPSMPFSEVLKQASKTWTKKS